MEVIEIRTLEETPPAGRRRSLYRQVGTVFGKIVFLLTAGMMIWKFLFFFYPVRGQMMYPGIRDGDLLLLSRVSAVFHIGDAVLARTENGTILARIEAQEGDEVRLDENGQVWINDSIWSEDVFYPTFPAEEGISFPYTVEEDSCFLLCDHRTDLRDSRQYGSIKTKDIVGKVIAVLRRRGI